jgi:hypothetical protein
MTSIRSPIRTIVIGGGGGGGGGANYWNLSGNNINNNNSGSVGINTSNPDISYSLDVSGSVNIRGNLVVNGSPVSGPSYTYSREHTIVQANVASGSPITFFEIFQGSGGGNTFSYNIATTSTVRLLGTSGISGGGIAFLCPTTLSNITGSINFGFADTSANDISLNIYKTSITNAYTSFATGATLLSSSRFVYTPSSVANITVPVNITSAGLTNNDIVYVACQLLPLSPTQPFANRVTLRYTLNFS